MDGTNDEAAEQEAGAQVAQNEDADLADLQGDQFELQEQEDDGEDHFLFDEYSIDDTLDPITRLERYHASDFSLQRMVLARDITDTARSAGHEDTMRRLVPILGAFVNDAEPNVRQTLAEQLPSLAAYLADGGESGYQELINHVLPYTFELLADKSADVGAVAVPSLLKICEYVRPEHFEQHVLHTIIAMAHDERTEEHRVISAQLFDDLAPHFGKELCLSRVVEEVAALAEDSTFCVRKTVGAHLGKLCSTVGPEAAVERILPIYQPLAKDMIWGVRKACAEAIVEISEGVTSEARKGAVTQIFRSFIDDISRWVRVAAYQKLGPFLHTFGVGNCCDDLLKMYIEMAFTGVQGQDSPQETDFAEYCAFNFPAVALTVGQERWGELEPAFTALCKDVQWKVRKTLSHSLHETAQIVGKEVTERCLSQAFDIFLRDLDEVRVGCVTNSPAFLRVMSPEAREPYVRMLCQMPDACDNWRLRMAVGARLGELAELVAAPFARAEIAPTICKLLNDPMSDVRSAVFESTAQLLGCLEQHTGEHRELLDYLLKLETEAGYQKRQMLAQIARYTAKHCTAELFTEYFLPVTARLSRDPVVNVRIVVARALTDVDSGLCRQPPWSSDPRLLEAVDIMRGDKDSDVSYFAGRLDRHGAPPIAASPAREADRPRDPGDGHA
eukprot:TRINITY_DN49931_c0_g1_i1.p1 TRINITY_DN49931_c0_g1~~TRINITY_DN49931_c0_g1_i1.p1  ORF type:complete len:707 (+),score=222.25 TRINITY_DN49931_c0_g1_i1:107-2122(+)